MPKCGASTSTTSSWKPPVRHRAEFRFCKHPPTIEKVRAQIGSGSPNTINPLLDAWWQLLASRLDAGPAALHRLPENVLHVAEPPWLQAL